MVDTSGEPQALRAETPAWEVAANGTQLAGNEANAEDESPLSKKMLDLLERFRGALVWTLLGIVFILGMGRAASKPLWYDELMTYGSALLPAWADVWKFYARGLDTPSPLSALLVHGVLHWPGSIELNARLPFLFAFLVMLFCMYRFMRNRYPAGYALAVLLIPIRIDRWFYYATEARVYAFVLGGVALAMVCWQAAGQERKSILHAIGLWFALAFAMFAHAFAIFLLVPFGAAQLLRDVRQRSVQWPVWIALLLFPLGYLPVMPGERMASSFYRANFFANPHLVDISKTFRNFLTDRWFFITAFVVFSLCALALHARRSLLPKQNEWPGFTNPEWLLLILLATMPLYAVPTAMLLGAYREPYVISLNLGIWLLAVGAVAEGLRRRRAAGGALLMLLVACLVFDLNGLKDGVVALLHPDRVHKRLLDEVRSESALQMPTNSTLPVMVGDHVLYTKLFYYADPKLRSRLFYPVDFEASAPYARSSTSQINFALSAKALGFHIADMPTINQRYPHFLFLKGYDPNVWFAPYLTRRAETDEQLVMMLRGEGRDFTLYDVHMHP